MEQKNYYVPHHPHVDECRSCRTPKVTKEQLDQYFGSKRKVIVIHPGEAVDEIVIRIDKGGTSHERY